MMKMKSLSEQLNDKIDETLIRYQYGMQSVSDGFNIIRWASKGLLTRKVDNDL